MKATFPQMGNLYIPLKALLEQMGVDVIVPPQITKRTLELGVTHSPEFACLPLKLTIGNFIEAIELGADTVIMAGGVGPCRFGYYAQVQREILKGLGYDFDMIVLEPPKGHFYDLMRQLRRLFGSNFKIGRVMRAIRLAWIKALLLDKAEELSHRIKPLECNRGDTERVFLDVVERIDRLQEEGSLRAIGVTMEEYFDKIPANDPITIIPKIGLVGEIYTVLEPFSNLFIERQLGELGAEVHRSIYITDWIRENLFPAPFRSNDHQRLLEHAKPYINAFVGGHGQETVAETVRFAQRGYHGVIHVMPFTCMPEIVAKSVLPQVSKEKSIPIMSIVLDEHSAETGLRTRLEAFLDMIVYKMEVEKEDEMLFGRRCGVSVNELGATRRKTASVKKAIFEDRG